MKFLCTAWRHGEKWRLRCDGADMGRVEVEASTKADALAKLEGEIRYRLELCPCSGESYRHLTIELVENAAGPPR